MIDKSNPIPLYYQIAVHIKNQIYAEVYPPRAKLPSEEELVNTFNVSRPTIRRALDELERQGLIYREQGRGSFVAPLFREVFGFGGFTERVQRMGFTPGSRLISQRVVDHLPHYLSTYLNLGPENDPSDRYLRVERVRLINDEPVALEKSYLPLSRFPGLDQIDFSKGSLYQVVSERYGRVTSAADSVFLPHMADQEDVEILNVHIGEAMLELWQRVWDQDRYVVEYTHALYNSKFAFRMHWSRVE